MSFTVTYGDALEYQGDAVLNSLGINGAVYGRLCKNIINGINRSEVKSLIDAQKNMPIGKIIETEGGDLKCEHVLHIVTPFKKEDDRKCTKLRDAYKSVVDFAIQRGYKKIGLPIIGTGANGYSDKEAYNAVIDVLSAVSDEENVKNIDIIDATVIAYLNPVPLRYQVGVRECNFDRIEFSSYERIERAASKRCERFYEYSKINEACEDEHSFYNVMQFVTDIDKYDMFFPQLFVKGRNAYALPYDFVDDYMAQHNLPLKTIKEYDSHKRQKTRYNQTLSKIDVFRFSVLLNLNKTEIIQFMSYCGYGFNPTSRLDMFFMDYIKGKYGIFGKQRKLYEMDMLFMPTAKDGVQFTV